MARRTKKVKRVLRGRLVPFVTLCASLIYIALFFGNFIGGAKTINGFNASLGLLDWPILSGFNIARSGAYFQEFFSNADLSLKPFSLGQLLSVFGTYLLPLGAAFGLISAALSVVFSLKNLVLARMKIKFAKLSFNMLIGSAVAVFSIPSLMANGTYFENFGEFLIFKTDLRAGVFGLLAIFVSLLLFIFPYFVRAIYRINYRINTLEQDSMARASDKVAYKRRKRYNKGYKSFR